MCSNVLFITRNNIHTNPCVHNFCPSTIFYCCFNYLPWYVIKLIYNCIFNFYMVLNYRYNYDLQLLLVWMKMKMKNVFISSQLVASNNINDNIIVFMIGNVLQMWLNNMWCLVQLELWQYIIIANVHVLMAR